MFYGIVKPLIEFHSMQKNNPSVLRLRKEIRDHLGGSDTIFSKTHY